MSPVYTDQADHPDEQFGVYNLLQNVDLTQMFQ